MSSQSDKYSLIQFSKMNSSQSDKCAAETLHGAEIRSILYEYVLFFIIDARALISGPASVARSATRLWRVLRRRASPPRGPRRAAGGEKYTIYARIYARKPSRNKVRLNASRTSRRRGSGCLGVSWRRNELFNFFVLVCTIV